MNYTTFCSVVAFSFYSTPTVSLTCTRAHTHTCTQAHAHTLSIARDPRCRMDVKGFVFCQQHSSTSHDYSVDSHREDRAKKVEDERRKKRVGKGCVGDWE